MKSPRTWLTAAAAILLVVAAYVLGVSRFNEHGDNNANYPDGTDWRCLEPKCGEVFHRTIKELAQHHDRHYGQPLPCPVCGSTNTRSTEKD